MYIEFRLPQGAGGQAALHANNIINAELHKWSDRYDIPYNVKNVKEFKRVTFDDEAQYAFFAMTWNVDKKFYALARWRIVSDLNNKIEFNSVV
jgi:hypothetical protein